MAYLIFWPEDPELLIGGKFNPGSIILTDVPSGLSGFVTAEDTGAIPDNTSGLAGMISAYLGNVATTGPLLDGPCGKVPELIVS